MDSLAQDVRYALRFWIRQPAFAALAVLALAAGIGATAAIFTVVNAALLRPLPFPHPSQLVAVAEVPRRQAGVFDARSVAPANFLDWAARTDDFARMAAFASRGANLTTGATPERIRTTVVSAAFFDVLGTPSQLGRTVGAGDDAGQGRVAVLSDGFWERRFGADRRVLGAAVAIDGEPFTVVGVMPASFAFPADTDAWVSSRRLVPDAAVDIGREAGVRGLHYLDVIARLRSGVTLAQARDRMDRVAAVLREQYPATNRERDVVVLPLHDVLVRAARPALLALMAAVACLLLVACANAATLLLARSETRRAEIAIRAALGATRARIVRQLLTESVLLAGIAGVAGLIVARWVFALLVMLAPTNVSAAGTTWVDAGVLGWTVVVSLMTGILFGVAPAWQTSRADLATCMQHAGASPSVVTGRTRLLDVIVVAQFAAAVVLVSGAGLLIRSFVQLGRVAPGFTAERVLTFRVAPTGARYRGDRQQAAFYTRVLAALEALPDVQAAGAIDNLPIAGTGSYLHFAVEGSDAGPNRPSANYRMIAAGYFRAMGIPLVKGRFFTERDDASAPAVAIVNDTFAKVFFAGAGAVGRRVSFNTDANGQPAWAQIVGVVGDVRTDGLVVPPKPEVYRPYQQRTWPGMSFVIRSHGDPRRVLHAVRSAVHDVDAEQPISGARLLDDVLGESIARPRLQAWLMTTFSGIALALAAIGIHAVVAYRVAQRRREIAIRLALGATRASVLQMVARDAFTLAGVGLVAGLAGAMAVARLMVGLLYNVGGGDGTTLAVTVLLIAAATLPACLVPARRAMRGNPMLVLREG